MWRKEGKKEKERGTEAATTGERKERSKCKRRKIKKCWDARMWHPAQRTHVRRGGTRRRGRDAADRASVPRPATWQLPNRADAVEIGADAAQIGPTRSISTVSAISINIGQRPIRPKQAEIDRENRRRGWNSDLRCVSCLILSLFCESSILMCFLRIF